MKERYDDPKFYDHVFYPKSAWKLVGAVALMPFFALGMFYLQEFLDPKKATSLQFKLTVIAVVTVLVVIPILILRLRQLKKVQLGINKAGLYVRGLGKFLAWSEIASIDLVRLPKRGKAVKIKLDTVQEGKKSSWLEFISRLIPVEQIETDAFYIYSKEFISIPLAELVTLLQAYHDQYKTEKIERQAPFGKPEKKFVQPDKDWLKKLPMFWVKVGLLVLVISGFFGYSLFIKGDAGADLLFSLVAATFATLAVLFYWFRVVFLLLAGIGLIVASLSLFFYQMVWEGKLEWYLLMITAAGFGLFFVVWKVTRKEKKLSVER